MQPPNHRHSNTPMRRGDAQGFIFGGVMAFIVGVFSAMAGSVPIPLVGNLTWEEKPVGFAAGVVGLFAFAVASIIYGFRKLRQAGPAERSIGSPVVRIGGAILVTAVALIIGGPLVAAGGKAVIVGVLSVGIGLFVFGLLSHKRIVMALGVLGILIAGLAQLKVDN